MRRLATRLFMASRALLYRTRWRNAGWVMWLAERVAGRMVSTGASAPIHLRFRGLELAVPAADAVFAASLAAGTYERGTLDAFATELRQLLAAPTPDGPPVVVDVGANIGVFTILAAQAGQGRWRVHAFEPSVDTVAMLQANLAANQCPLAWVTIHPACVGGADGQTLFAVGGVPTGRRILRREEGGGQAVTVVRLDTVLASERQRVRLVKIDTEGHEPEVLAGARALLRASCATVFLEYHPPSLARAGADPAAFLEALQREYGDVWYVDEISGRCAVVPCRSRQWPGLLRTAGANLILRPTRN
jgi:FkbM family methyltransferase